MELIALCITRDGMRAISTFSLFCPAPFVLLFDRCRLSPTSSSSHRALVNYSVSRLFLQEPLSPSPIDEPVYSPTSICSYREPPSSLVLLRSTS